MFKVQMIKINTNILLKSMANFLLFCFIMPLFSISVRASDPKISIVIPVYNAHKTVDRCIMSARQQTLPDIEIICVNDGSTDASRTCLEKHAKEDPRIKVVNKTNGGASSARNTGLELATGEFIAFIDSDDWVDEEAFERAYRMAIEHRADVVTFGAWCTEIDTGKEWYWGPKKNYYFPGNGVISFLDPDGYYSVIWNKIFRTDLIKTNRIRFRTDMRNKEDTVFVLDVIPYVKNAVSLHDAFYHQQRSPMGLNKTATAQIMVTASRTQAEHFVRTWKHPDLQNYRFIAEVTYDQWLDWVTKKHLPSVGASSIAITEYERYCKPLMND
ncbi:MAG: glycosyltransferase [Oscillospiraceae bacterium]|jgi:glycosyltransferase involved in cell wall biosynthesis|nr:glycosyltransferase [Oscillospiraceae bacterium]